MRRFVTKQRRESLSRPFRHTMMPMEPAHRSLTCLLTASVIVLYGLNGCVKRGSDAPPADIKPTTPVTASAEAPDLPPDTTQDMATIPGLEDREYAAPLKDAYDRIDPAADGWQSEAVSEVASQSLATIAQVIEGTEGSHDTLSKIVALDFRATSLRPTNLTPIQASGFIILRGHGESISNETGVFREAGGLSDAIRRWLSDVKLQAPHAKFKLYQVEQSAQGVTTRAFCTLTGVSGPTHIQVNSTWNCVWNSSPGSVSDLKLKSIEVEDYEEVTASSAAPRFVDCTATLLGQNECWKKQFQHGTDYWRSRIPRDFGLDVAANHGLAIGDVNGDHLDDVYVCQQGGLPNRLLIQQPDGTLKDQTQESGTGWLDYCASALIVDFDNDGDADLAVSQDFRLLIMENDGSARFQLAFLMNMQAQSYSMAAADYDSDGKLDLYICGYNATAARMRSGALGEPLPYHDANNGGRNTLLRNRGEWRFDDVTSRVGLDQNNSRFSFSASWEDYDNDGDVDLYVANDYGRNNLYRNDNQSFKDIAAELGVEDTSAGMSVSWSDCNRDGQMDFYVSNMFSSAGNRITYQEQFKSDVDESVREQFQRMARGNSLYVGTSDGHFRDVSQQANVTMGRWSWGSRFADINNDGWDDIVVANGFITAPDTGDL